MQSGNGGHSSSGLSSEAVPLAEGLQENSLLLPATSGTSGGGGQPLQAAGTWPWPMVYTEGPQASILLFALVARGRGLMWRGSLEQDTEGAACFRELGRAKGAVLLLLTCPTTTSISF